MINNHYMVVGLIGIYILLALMVIHMYCTYRKNLGRVWRKYNAKRFLVSVLLPSLIPFVITVVMAFIEEDNVSISEWLRSTEGIFLISMCAISVIALILQFIEWRKEHEDKKTEWVNRIFREAYDKLYDVLKLKYSMYRTSALKHEGGIPSEKIEYDVFDNIRNICEAYRIAIARITNIPTTHINISFIYHYNYPNATEKDKAWRWIVGKGSNLNTALEEFIERRYAFPLYDGK